MQHGEPAVAIPQHHDMAYQRFLLDERERREALARTEREECPSPPRANEEG